MRGRDRFEPSSRTAAINKKIFKEFLSPTILCNLNEEASSDGRGVQNSAGGACDYIFSRSVSSANSESSGNRQERDLQVRTGKLSLADILVSFNLE